MSIKTVCEDVFNISYKQSLKGRNPAEELGKRIENLEKAVYLMRLFQYLLSIGEVLNVQAPEPQGVFSKDFKQLLEEVLKAFYERYGENFDLSEEEFVNTFLKEAPKDIETIGDHLENLIILLLGFLVDKTLSELFTITKIKNLIRESRGKDIPLL
jgi:ferritin